MLATATPGMARPVPFDLEAGPERIRHHLRRPVPGRRDLLTQPPGNTVNEIDPRSVLPVRAGVVRSSRRSPTPGRWCSPYARGWSVPQVARAARPAGSPYARGWSAIDARIASPWTCSPYARGWSDRHRFARRGYGALPVRAGVVRIIVSSRNPAAGAPVRAGVVRCRQQRTGPCSGAPRTRGVVRPGSS